MKDHTKNYGLVNRELERLDHELLELRDTVNELRAAQKNDADLSRAVEQVTAAADAVAAAIQAWVPRLVPTPRALDEVLHAIASWQPDPRCIQAAKNAQLLFEQLQAQSYRSELNPDDVPDLDEFIADLRATVTAIERALS
jgi:hypothetical protein